MASQLINIPHTENPSAVDYDQFAPKRGRPMLFQVCDPVFQRPLYPVLLALHVNPQTFSEKMQKTKNVVMTYGGFIEYIWPDELDSLSADMTSGAFISPRTGLTAGSVEDSVHQGRQGTIAWERQEDLLELFRQNGCVFNGMGQPILRGRILCIYDRGIFAGHFTSFNVSETDDKAFTFQLQWEFKVEQTIYKYPKNAQLDSNSVHSTSNTTPISQVGGGGGGFGDQIVPPLKNADRALAAQFSSVNQGQLEALPNNRPDPAQQSNPSDNNNPAPGKGGT